MDEFDRDLDWFQHEPIQTPRKRTGGLGICPPSTLLRRRLVIVDKIVYNFYFEGGTLMLRLYSKGCEYAIRGLIHCAPRRNRSNITIKDVCRKAGIPEAFTRKMFQSLVKKGIVLAVPGPRGGYRLGRPAREINILDIIRAVDGEAALDTCLMGLRRCNDRNACALHTTWKKAKRNLWPALKARTLSDLYNTVNSQHNERRRGKL
jgi:Rrf2 family protein